MRVKVSIVTLLVGLLFIKVSAFHVYEHQNADNQVDACGFCDLAIENQQSELVLDFSVPEATTLFAEYPILKITLPGVAFTPLHRYTYIFTRPPPARI